MRNKILGLISIILIFAILLSGCNATTQTSKQKFTIAWSIYVGWMPYPYMQESGILKKWADKYNIEIEVKQFDYVPSIEAYSSGKVDGVTITNMDSFGVVGSVDSTVVIIGDYSNGNDKIITRGIRLSDFNNKSIYIVENSVSQYLLSRALSMNTKLSEKDTNIFNVSDSDIGSAFLSNKSQPIVVTWNPICLEILDQDKSAKSIFDSSNIPYEILDMLLLRTDTVTDHPELAQALSGAWYETIALMKNKDTKLMESIALKAGTTVESINQQLETTYMYWTPNDAKTLMESNKLYDVMDLVRNFSYEHGIFGQGYKSANNIGILLPNNKIMGDSNNIKLRFVSTFLK